jgi:NAD-dependent SIR2 family protein deacetylase
VSPENLITTYRVERLHAFLLRHPSLLVLTGAGVSTGSGIPGYRDADGRWARSPPVQWREFIDCEAARRRYWRRSMAGWPLLAGARPNAAHRALARLETAGRIEQLVTQNVDGLHQRAGSSRLIELHGNARRATCLGCGTAYSRAAIQRMLVAGNPQFASAPASDPAADGDADIEAANLASFRAPICAACGGVLKPDVVFFGECVPRERVDAAREALVRADALLVVGSSLMVYSGYRFCEWAARMAKPIAAINLGRTRADAMLTLKVERPCGEALATLALAVGG